MILLVRRFDSRWTFGPLDGCEGEADGISSQWVAILFGWADPVEVE